MYTKNRVNIFIFFLTQGGATKCVLPVFGKRGDKTQTWRTLQVRLRECGIEVIL